METSLQGVRSDGTPLVLVRCSCGWMRWTDYWPDTGAFFCQCVLCREWQFVKPQLSLAEADVAYPEVQKEQLVA